MSSTLEGAINDLELWIWQTNLEGKYIYSRTPENNWLGYVDKEILTLGFSDLIIVENSPSGQSLQRSIEDNERLLAEAYVLAADGKHLPVMVCAKPQFDEANRFTGYKGVSTLISEENLDEFEENIILHHLLDALASATVATTPDGKIEYVNNEFTNLFGYTKEEAINQPISILDSSEGNSLNSTANSISLLKDSGSFSLIRHRRNKNGDELTLLIKAKAVIGLDGEVTHFVGSYTDISELITIKGKLEKTTRENTELRHRLEILDEDLTEYQRIGKIGSWRLDLATGDVDWTEELYVMLGLDPIDPPPNYSVHSQLFTKESFALLEPAIEEAGKTGKPYELELEYISKSGKHGWMMARGEGIKDEQGNVNQVRGIAMDITHLKEIESKLQEMYQELQATLDQTVGVISRIVEFRDPYTAGHQKRVALIASAIAEKMQLSREFIRGVNIASQLHDIGKIGIPAEILVKPNALTDQEFTLVKEHSNTGYELLKDIHFPWPIAEISRQHHERIDGSGYPNSLRGNQILLQARIIAVADVVESMLTHRPYRPALGLERALEEISSGSGSKYDADVVAACLSLFKDDNFTLP